MITYLTSKAKALFRATLFFCLYIGMTAGSLKAADYYWVGGSGNWSNYASHWATSSGGVVFHTSLPGPNDNVYFDANSFTADSQFVFVDSTFAYCFDMDWTGVQYNVRFSIQGWPSSKINVYGSLILNPNIYAFRSGINFAGNNAGLVINTNQVSVEAGIVFNGSGSWNLLSDLTTWGIDFQTGSFYSDGFSIETTGVINAFSASNPAVDFSGSEVTTSGLFVHSNPNFNGANSRIIIMGSVQSSRTLLCTDHAFGTIIFDCPFGKLHGKVVADSVIFLDDGSVLSNQSQPVSLSCNYLKFHGTGSLRTSSGQTSSIGYAEFSSNILYGGSNTFDTLVWNNPGSDVDMTGTITINDTFILNNDCSSIVTFTGNSVGSLVKTSGTVQLDYVRLGGIQASGGATFIANNSFDLGNNSGWQINSPAARNVYWVNGGGSWSDSNHWSLTSGGPGGACSPNQFDNLYFDAQSFSTANDTVIIDREIIYSNDLNFIGVTGNPHFYSPGSLSVNFTLNVFGSFMADSPGELMGYIQLSGSNPNNTFNNGPLSLFVDIDGTGTWSLTDDISQVNFRLKQGVLNTNNFNLSNCGFYVYSGVSGVRTIDFGTSTMNNCGADFSFTNPANIISQNSNWIFDSGSNSTLRMNNNTFNNLLFLGNGTIYGSFISNALQIDSTHNVTGDTITVQSMELSGDGLLDGVFNVDTLIQNTSGVIMNLGDSTVIKVADFIEMDGASCDQRTTLQSNTIAFILKPAGIVDFDFVNLRNINAGGGAVYNATNTIDLGGNTGWNITSPAARTLYWVGGTGNWSDQNHWSLSSGGAGGNCIPTASDDVVIDNNSFVLPGNEMINVDMTDIYFNNLLFSSPNFYDYIDIDDNDFIHVYGSLVFSSKANFGGNFTSSRANFLLKGANAGNTITTSGTVLDRIIVDAAGDYSINDSLTCERINFRNGAFFTNNHAVHGTNIRVDAGSAVIDFGASDLYADTLDVQLAGTGFNGASASVKFTVPQTGGNMMYSSGQEFAYMEAPVSIGIIGGFRAGEAHFYNDINYFNTSDSLYIGKGIFYRNFNSYSNGLLSFDTLIFNNNGYTVQMYDGSTLLINGEIIVNNSPSFPIQLLGYNNGTFNFEKPAGLVCMDNMIMRGVHAVGNGIFYAGANTLDLGNNSGWTYASCNPNNSDVWPGDANYDLTVDNFDVLYLGLAYNQNGPARTGASNAWVAQPASDWLYQFANGANIKNADCNGNGVINNDDTTAISLNYGLTHPLRIQPPIVSALPPVELFLVADPDTVVLGDTIHIDIHLGTPLVPVDSIYGIAFTISFDSTLIDTTYMEFDYSNSWMGVQGSNLLNFEKKFLSQGQVDVAITRTDYMNAAGDGIIVTTGVVVIDNIGARLGSAPPYVNFPITLSNPRALTASEYYLAISLGDDSVEIDTSQTVGIPDLNMISNGIQVFPIPANGNLFVQSGNTQITEIEIFDMVGSVTAYDLQPSRNQQLDVSALPNGVYGMKIVTPAGIIKRKLVIKH